MKLHTAIGTASAIGFSIALAGVAGDALNGLFVAGLPPYSVGYVYLPALNGLTTPGRWPRPGARNSPIVHRSSNYGGSSQRFFMPWS